MPDTPQNMSGVSTPPPDSAIVADNPDTSADITGPNANDQTVPQTAAASIPPSTPQPSQTPAPAAGATPQQPAPGQPQAPTALTGKPPVPGQQTTTPTTPAPVQDQAVAKASRFYDVAQALAGGPRYKYDVDAYGQMQKTR